MDKEMMMREEDANSIVEVDLGKVRRNVERIRAHIGPKVEILYTAKSNGYGHGLVTPTLYLQKECGVKYFSTGMVSEAMELRAAGFDGYLLVMGGFPESAVADLVRYDLLPTLYNCDQARMVAAEARRQNRKVKAHLKIETGLNRLGVKEGGELEALLRTLEELPEIQLDGMYTHLGNAYSLDKTYTHFQLAQFDRAIGQVHAHGVYPRLIHAANTAATIGSPEAYYDMVRLAAAIFGMDISPGEHNRLHLETCLRWTTFVTNIRCVEPGDSISYYFWQKADRPMKIAILGFGMGDGYVRTLAMRDASKNADVLIRGRRARLLDLNFDQAFADVTDIPDVRIGDTVTLVGRDGDEEITTMELADKCGTSNGHVCCTIGNRPFKKYLR